MQLSESTKRMLKAVLFAGIFVILMIILDAAFLFDEGATENMLASYSKTDDIDTIFVGNSAGGMMDAVRYSGISGSHAFNMSTPSQGLSVSLKNIQLAASQHRIKHVILLLTFDTFNSESYDAIDHLYNRTLFSGCPLPSRIRHLTSSNIERSFTTDTINTEKSVNIWIPWENETSHGLNNLKNNFSGRIRRFSSGSRLGDGFAYDLCTAKYETYPGIFTADDISELDRDMEKAGSLPLPDGMITSDKITLMAEICSFCRDNDLSLLVIVTPHRSDYYDRFDGFRSYSEELSDYLDYFLSKREILYYNTEEDPDLHRLLPDKYFSDWEHISDPYTDSSTDYLTDVIQNMQ